MQRNNDAYFSKNFKRKKVTGYYAWKDDIENAGGTFVDEPSVIDGILSHPHTINSMVSGCVQL